MYKVFSHQTPIIITKSLSGKYRGGAVQKTIQNATLSDFEEENQKAFDTPSSIPVVLHTQKPDALLKVIKKSFLHLKAAGGLVKNGDGDFLLIERLGKWDLPKGKIEANEGKKEAAIREVQEECGLEKIELQEKIARTYHTYKLKGEWVFKTTNWFAMEVYGVPDLKPQAEEDITSAVWMPLSDFEKVKANTYGNILTVLASAELEG